MCKGRSHSRLFPGNPPKCNSILTQGSCGCLCQSISTPSFPTGFSSFHSAPWLRGRRVIPLSMCVCLYGQTDFVCVSIRTISIWEVSWVTLQLCDGAQERRWEGIPGVGRGTVAFGSSLGSTRPGVTRNCDMSDCGFVKPLSRLIVSVVLSWNKTGFVCPPWCAMTKVFVCRSLEAGRFAVWDRTAW